MVASSRNAGNDEPFVYDIPSGLFVSVTGVTSANTPSSPATFGDWTPPTMALVGGKILVSHPGFNAAGGYYFGVLDINNPAIPAWSAGNLTGAISLTTKPISIQLYSGRAWYAVNNALVFSDTNNPINCTAGTQVVTLGTNQSIVAVGGTPLISTTQGGIIQSLTVFTTSNLIYQITGDAALSTLTLNQLNVETGTYSQNSIAPTPQGLCFVSPEGVRFIQPNGLVSDPLGVSGQGIVDVFVVVPIPTRIALAYAGDVIRFNVPITTVAGASIQEFFYHLSRKIWSGPHTFPASLIQGFGSSFIITPVGVPSTLFKSNVLATSTDTFVENGNQMSWQIVTPLLPATDDMAMHEVTEQTIALAVSTTDTYTFSFTDESGAALGTTTIPSTATLSLWGTAIWGVSLWGGASKPYRTFRLDYSKSIIFSQASFSGSGNSSGAFRIGPSRVRLRHLGYVAPYASA